MSPVRSGIRTGSSPWSPGVGGIPRILFSESSVLAFPCVVGSELEVPLVFCNSICIMYIVWMRGGSLRIERGAWPGDLVVGSQFFCIITSLVSGGVMFLPGFVIVVGSCGGVVSIVGSI